MLRTATPTQNTAVHGANALAQQLGGMNLNGSNHLSYMNKTKIYKWNVKFTGDEKSLSVFEFIQRVEAKAKAYDVEFNELIHVVSELFDGFAAKWFASQTINNWSDLKDKLVSDFVQVDYLENLLDIIRQRKQLKDESVVHFLTVFEDDCSRLRNKLTLEEKLNILKKNILQKYRPYVALSKYESINEFKHALKILEMSMSFDNNSHPNRFVRFSSNERNNNTHDNRDKKYNSSNGHRSRYDNFLSD